ncbi:MAG: M14 family metallopeptidase [Bdellovibrionales bacterium]
MKLKHNEYMKFSKLTQTLKDFADEYPHLCRLQSLGKTQGGSDIWMMSITNFLKSSAESKPGFWVDGNTHATELAGSQACVHLIDKLLTESETTRIKDLLNHVTFYIVPRISVEGAEAALTEGKFVRSSTEVYPIHLPDENFEEKDLDQDGEILMMRIPDPSGAFKICSQDSRLMLVREPHDTEGPFYHLIPEGEFKNFDGFHRNFTDPHRFDLNRQAPAGFSPTEYGAGPMPLFLKEARVIAEAFVARPHIIGATTHHTFGGYLLRPSSARPDADFNTHDMEVFKIQGNLGEEATGYKAYSIYHDFKYDPKRVTTGAWDDWHYDHRGVFSWTTEIWSLAIRSGVKFDKPLQYYQNPGSETLRKMWAWCEQNLKPSDFFKPWKSYQHSQLGPVEIGGWRLLYTVRNPPPQFLQDELEKVTEFTLRKAQMSPRLTAEVFKIEKMGEKLHRIQIKIQNAGFLPSYGSEMAKSLGVYDAPRATLKLDPNQKLKIGKLEYPLKHLSGRSFSLPWVSPFWGSEITNSHEDLITYVIEGEGVIHWRANYGMGGHLELKIVI